MLKNIFDIQKMKAHATRIKDKRELDLVKKAFACQYLFSDTFPIFISLKDERLEIVSVDEGISLREVILRQPRWKLISNLKRLILIERGKVLHLRESLRISAKISKKAIIQSEIMMKKYLISQLFSAIHTLQCKNTDHHGITHSEALFVLDGFALQGEEFSLLTR